MKLKSAISKLEKCGYKVQQSQSHSYLYDAKKGNSTIRLRTELDPLYATEILESVFFSRDDGRFLKCENLTKALKVLGEVPAKSAESMSKLSREELIKIYVESGPESLTVAQIQSLNIRSLEQLSEIFSSLFKKQLASSRRYSSRRHNMQKLIERRKGELWQSMIEIFLGSNPDAMPLRRVEIVAQVEGAAVTRDYWGSIIKPEVRAVTPVFARSAEGARATVKALLGEFAQVQDLGVSVIGPAEDALEMYAIYKGIPGAQEAQKKEVEQAHRNINEVKERLAKAQSALELAEKKLELAKFLDGFATLATMSSQGKDVVGDELN